jgi:hypothetical protein
MWIRIKCFRKAFIGEYATKLQWASVYRKEKRKFSFRQVEFPRSRKEGLFAMDLHVLLKCSDILWIHRLFLAGSKAAGLEVLRAVVMKRTSGVRCPVFSWNSSDILEERLARTYKEEEYIKQETNMKQTRFLLVSWVAHSQTLKIEARFYSEISVDTQWTTRRCIPECTRRTFQKAYGFMRIVVTGTCNIS